MPRLSRSQKCSRWPYFPAFASSSSKPARRIRHGKLAGDQHVEDEAGTRSRSCISAASPPFSQRPVTSNVCSVEDARSRPARCPPGRRACSSRRYHPACSGPCAARCSRSSGQSPPARSLSRSAAARVIRHVQNVDPRRNGSRARSGGASGPWQDELHVPAEVVKLVPNVRHRRLVHDLAVIIRTAGSRRQLRGSRAHRRRCRRASQRRRGTPRGRPSAPPRARRRTRQALCVTSPAVRSASGVSFRGGTMWRPEETRWLPGGQ